MLRSCITKSYLFSTFTDTSKNPCKIDFVDGIFACKLRFLYSQRSKCADLLNSYDPCSIKCRYSRIRFVPKILNATIIVKGMIIGIVTARFPSEHVSANNAAPLPKKFTITAPPDSWNAAKILF